MTLNSSQKESYPFAKTYDTIRAVSSPAILNVPKPSAGIEAPFAVTNFIVRPSLDHLKSGGRAARTMSHSYQGADRSLDFTR
jgi:hypothetical protein